MSYSLLSLADWPASFTEWFATLGGLSRAVPGVPADTLSVLPVVVFAALSLVWFAARQGHASLSSLLLHYMLLPCLNIALLLWLTLTLMPSSLDVSYQLEMLLAHAGR